MSDNLFDTLRIGQTFGATRQFTAPDIRAVAALIGDENYLHHDAERAAETRFGGLIASGGHTTGAMGAVVATYFDGQSLGLDLAVEMKGAVRAGDTITIEWEITALEPKPRWAGGVVSLAGQATNQRGEVVMTGRMKALVSPRAIAGRPVPD